MADVKAADWRFLKMPIYEYECDECGRFEELQKASDTPLEKCPKCGGKAKRVMSTGTSFILKGGGWAFDGYQKVKC